MPPFPKSSTTVDKPHITSSVVFIFWSLWPGNEAKQAGLGVVQCSGYVAKYCWLHTFNRPDREMYEIPSYLPKYRHYLATMALLIEWVLKNSGTPFTWELRVFNLPQAFFGILCCLFTPLSCESELFGDVFFSIGTVFKE